MKEIVALVYKYFCAKKLPTPYFRTIMVFSGLIIIHLILLYAIFPIPNSLNPFGASKNDIENWIPTGIVLFIIYFTVSFVYKKNALKNYYFNKNQIKKTMRNILLYFIIILFLIFLASFFHIRNAW